MARMHFHCFFSLPKEEETYSTWQHPHRKSRKLCGRPFVLFFFLGAGWYNNNNNTTGPFSSPDFICLDAVFWYRILFVGCSDERMIFSASEDIERKITEFSPRVRMALIRRMNSILFGVNLFVCWVFRCLPTDCVHRRQPSSGWANQQDVLFSFGIDQWHFPQVTTRKTSGSLFPFVVGNMWSISTFQLHRLASEQNFSSVKSFSCSFWKWQFSGPPFFLLWNWVQSINLYGHQKKLTTCDSNHCHWPQMGKWQTSVVLVLDTWSIADGLTILERPAICRIVTFN